MSMNVIETAIPGVLVIELGVFRDHRGYLFESWSRDRYREAGLLDPFVQDNVSFSTKGVLRGLHYQEPNAQGKLLSVLDGEIFDVAVDIRQGSPTFGKHVAMILSRENRRQFYVPPGFAHGFVVLSDRAFVSYKCTDFYQPKHERSVRWDDPELAIPWPVADPILNGKDREAPLLRDVRDWPTF